MGLLLGRWVTENGATGAEVTHVTVLTRTDKRKDRVEVGYEQLASAAESGDEGATGGSTGRAKGWSCGARGRARRRRTRPSRGRRLRGARAGVGAA